MAPILADMDDWVVQALVAGAGALVVLSIIARVRRSVREARYAAQRRRELRETRGYLYMQQQEIERLASRIVATSSTGSIAGYEIVRQIEAVFTDGHVAPARAVEVLKAVAAEKGANALIHLATERAATGKYLASGDAVVVRATIMPA